MSTLLTWTDRGPRAIHPRNRPRNVGPIKTLLRVSRGGYERVVLMSTHEVLSGARQLALELEQMGLEVLVRLIQTDGTYGGLYESMHRVLLEHGCSCDGLISAGSPKARAGWLALTASGLFQGRLLQVVDGEVRQVKLPPICRPVVQSSSEPVYKGTLRDAVSETEREVISGVLAMNQNNLLQTARHLDIDRNTLKRKMRQMGLRN